MRHTIIVSVAVLSAAFAISGCASSTPGSRPADMSASQHEAAAKAHDSDASSHAAAAPSGAPAKTSCSASKGEVPCWTSDQNPTETHLRDAERHAKMAADHRAAAASLRDAEARSCAGIAPADRDMSPFHHREDVVSATEIEQVVPRGKVATSKRTEGAAIVVRAVPGLTREYLQRTVDCHVARSAVMGTEMPEMAFCPLAVKGVKATVESVGNGFRVEVRASSPEGAQEVLRRAAALAPGATK